MSARGAAGAPKKPAPKKPAPKTSAPKTDSPRRAAPQQPAAKSPAAKGAKPKQTAARELARPAAAKAAPQVVRAAGDTAVRHWLLKTDPDSFPFDHLWEAPRRTTGWSGVRNHLARNFLRDGMRPGDLALIYHSSCDPAGVIGVGRIVGAPRPDPTQFDPRDEHFDAKSRREEPTWWEVDVQALVRCPRFVSLADLRGEPALAGMAVLQKGQRLSVQPVEPAHFARVLALAGVPAADLRG